MPRPAEMLPATAAVGQLLSLEEVRYCVFQGRRLKPLPVATMIVKRGNDSVRRFNTLLADFNSRCKSFRYAGDALQSANKQADARRDQLKADADDILTSWTGQSPTALIDLQARRGACGLQVQSEGELPRSRRHWATTRARRMAPGARGRRRRFRSFATGQRARRRRSLGSRDAILRCSENTVKAARFRV